MSNLEWVYKTEEKGWSESLIRKEANVLHPLRYTTTDKEGSVNCPNLNDNPLSALTVAKTSIIDPLSIISGGTIPNTFMSISNTSSNIKQDKLKSQFSDTTIDKKRDNQWAEMKQNIVRNFSYNGEIVLSSTTINDFEGVGIDDGSSTRPLDKYSQRLANFEKRMVVDNKVKLSQSEYEAHIKKLANELQIAWSKDERAGSLKIAIQLAKLLADTTIPQFYPTMFVMISNELDIFGNMVYQRLRRKAEEATGIKLSENFSVKQIPLIARETCRNWFYKVSCIRELIPRLYIEMVIMKCYRFLHEDDDDNNNDSNNNNMSHDRIVSRVYSSIRGIGNPLVSLYARLYLSASVTNTTASSFSKQVMIHSQNDDDNNTNSSNNTNNNNDNKSGCNYIKFLLLQDSFYTFKTLKQNNNSDTSTFTVEIQNRAKITGKEYFRLLSPVFDWLIKYISVNATTETFHNIMELYHKYCNDAMILKYIIDYFDVSLFYSDNVQDVISYIKSAEQSCFTTIDLYNSLGKQFITYFPKTGTNTDLQQFRSSILNDVTQFLSQTEDISAYIRCCIVWIEVVQKHYHSNSNNHSNNNHYEINTLLSNLCFKLSNSNSNNINSSNYINPSYTLDDTPIISDHLQAYLESIVMTLLNINYYSTNILLLKSEHLLKVLDMFSSLKKIHICKEILLAFKQHPSTNDTNLLNTMFYICRILHDSIDNLSSDGEKRHISKFLSIFIHKIDFDRDLEQQLMIYTECRALFYNLDSIQDLLIQCVCNLAMKVVKLTRGKRTKKTASFVKSCLAYCHITVPSINNTFRKLELLLLCTEVSLANQCLLQTDAFLKSIMLLIPEAVFATITLSSGAVSVVIHDNNSGSIKSSSSSNASTSSPSTAYSQDYHHQQLIKYLRQLLSLLIVVPGNPTRGPFCQFHDLRHALSVSRDPRSSSSSSSSMELSASSDNINHGNGSITNNNNNSNSGGIASTEIQIKVYIDMMAALSVMSHTKKLPYHIPMIQSNDKLYGGSKEYQVELKKITHDCIADVLKLLATIGVDNKVKQARLCVDFANQLVIRFETHSPEVISFINNLLLLVEKTKSILNSQDLKYYENTVAFVKAKLVLVENKTAIQLQ